MTHFTHTRMVKIRQIIGNASENVEKLEHSSLLVGQNMVQALCRTVWQFLKKSNSWDFPGGAVYNIPRSQCRGPGFNPWSEN